MTYGEVLKNYFGGEVPITDEDIDRYFAGFSYVPPQNEKTLVYLATPYSHESEEVREQRFNNVNKYAAELIKKGFHVYSPISHSHPINKVGNLPTSWKFWKEHDEAILQHCKKLIVLCQEGWKESVGVQAEIEIAQSYRIPVEYYPCE